MHGLGRRPKGNAGRTSVFISLSASWLLMQYNQLPHDGPYPQLRAQINPPSLCHFSQTLCTAVGKVTNTRSDVSNFQIPIPIIPNLRPSKTPGREGTFQIPGAQCYCWALCCNSWYCSSSTYTSKPGIGVPTGTIVS